MDDAFGSPCSVSAKLQKTRVPKAGPTPRPGHLQPEAISFYPEANCRCGRSTNGDQQPNFQNEGERQQQLHSLESHTDPGLFLAMSDRLCKRSVSEYLSNNRESETRSPRTTHNMYLPCLKIRTCIIGDEDVASRSVAFQRPVAVNAAGPAMGNSGLLSCCVRLGLNRSNSRASDKAWMQHLVGG